MARLSKIFMQESIIGTAIGIVLGAIVFACLSAASTSQFFPMPAMLPSAVSIGIFCGILLATLSGTLIPFACKKFKVDPALVAGPFITSFNDVIGAMSYLFVAQHILNLGS